jgi:RNA polymerase primary sigma factor
MMTNITSVTSEQELGQGEMEPAAEDIEAMQAELEREYGETPDDTTRHQELAGVDEGTLDSVQNYMSEIGRVPLLTAAEEVQLAEQMTCGDVAKKRLVAAEELAPQLRTALRGDLERGDMSMV